MNRAVLLFVSLATLAWAQQPGMKQVKNLAGGDWVAITNPIVLVAPKLDRSGGTSTNQTLYSATITNKLSFGTSFTDALLAGQIAWDSDWQTFCAGLGNGVEGQFFQESHIYGKNVSGQIVTNGMVVRLSGAVGSSGKLEFTLAVADGTVRPSYMLGVATEDIAVGAFGRITWFGNVSQIDTTGALYGETGWTNNMPVFVSTNSPGYLTKYEPQAPQPRISVGAVINRHAQNGAILVRPTWGMKITDADDVDGTPLTTTGQIMVWDNARKVFDFTDNIGRYATASAVATQKTYRVWDRYSESTFSTMEYGTTIVWRVSGPFQGLTVTLSPDFEVISNHVRPSWTIHDFPFVDGDWNGTMGADYHYISYAPSDAEWRSASDNVPTTLVPVGTEIVQGTAVVSNREYYVTNEIARLVSAAQLAEAKTEISVGVTNLVESATNALTQSSHSILYGSLTVTNQTGFASFAAANPVQTYTLIGAGTGASTNTAYFQWPVSGGRVLSASTIAYLSPGSLGVVASSCLSVYDGSGILLASNVASTTLTAWGELPFLTNVLVNASVPSNGTIRLSVTVAKTTGQPGARLYVGGATPLALALTQTTSAFATSQENEALRLRTAQVMAQWYDDTGVVTQQILRIGDSIVTNRWGPHGATNITDGVTSGTYSEATRTFDISNLLAGVSVELPDGIVTNGSAADLNSLDVRGSITIGGDTTYNTWARHLYQAVYPDFPDLYAQGILFDNANNRELTIFHVANDGSGGIVFKTGLTVSSQAERIRIDTASGNVSVSNSITVAGTNTAAVVRSTGGYIIGPAISGKQAHIFTDGTNCFFVNVNNVTNALTTN